jgi:hypothetical protein
MDIQWISGGILVEWTSTCQFDPRLSDTPAPNLAASLRLQEIDPCGPHGNQIFWVD